MSADTEALPVPVPVPVLVDVAEAALDAVLPVALIVSEVSSVLGVAGGSLVDGVLVSWRNFLTAGTSVRI